MMLIVMENAADTVGCGPALVKSLSGRGGEGGVRRVITAEMNDQVLGGCTGACIVVICWTRGARCMRG